VSPAPADAPAPSDARPPQRPLLRRSLRALAVVAALLLVVALSSPWWFNARRVADLALAQTGNATGLDWTYDGEPALRWRPQPWLSLPRLEVRDATGRRVLAAERLEIALPWSTLRGESLRVDALRLDAPDIDLDAALAWWDAQPAGDVADLPRLEGLALTRGRLHWEGGALQDVELTLPRFALDAPMTLALRGQWIDTTADGVEPMALALQLDARPKAGPLRLEGMALRLEGAGPIPAATALGRLQFAPWTLDARGEIAAWPDAWPALPAPLSASASPLAFTLAQHGESAMAATTRLTLQRDTHEVEIEGTPAAVMAWREDADAAALPPLRVRAVLPDVALDGVRLEGVTVEMDEDVAAPTEADDGGEPVQ